MGLSSELGNYSPLQATVGNCVGATANQYPPVAGDSRAARRRELDHAPYSFPAHSRRVALTHDSGPTRFEAGAGNAATRLTGSRILAPNFMPCVVSSSSAVKIRSSEDSPDTLRLGSVGAQSLGGIGPRLSGTFRKLGPGPTGFWQFSSAQLPARGFGIRPCAHPLSRSCEPGLRQRCFPLPLRSGCRRE